MLFLGVGDATDFALGQTSVLFTGSKRLLVDCGPQVPSEVARRLKTAGELDGVFLSHGHADHCFGLPSLLLWLRQSGRKSPLALLAEERVLDAVDQLIERGYPGAFEPSKCFAIERHRLSPERPHALGALTLSIAPTSHNLPSYALRVEDAGATCAFSGDGKPTLESTRLYSDVHLLVHECAFAERISVNHTNLSDLSEVHRAARPQQFAVVHCTREDRPQIEHAMKARFGASVACPRPGTTIELPNPAA